LRIHDFMGRSGDDKKSGPDHVFSVPSTWKIHRRGTAFVLRKLGIRTDEIITRTSRDRRPCVSRTPAIVELVLGIGKTQQRLRGVDRPWGSTKKARRERRA
jgi:hypothetical protein